MAVNSIDDSSAEVSEAVALTVTSAEASTAAVAVAAAADDSDRSDGHGQAAEPGSSDRPSRTARLASLPNTPARLIRSLTKPSLNQGRSRRRSSARVMKSGRSPTSPTTLRNERWQSVVGADPGQIALENDLAKLVDTPRRLFVPDGAEEVEFSVLRFCLEMLYHTLPIPFALLCLALEGRKGCRVRSLWGLNVFTFIEYLGFATAIMYNTLFWTSEMEYVTFAEVFIANAALLARNFIVSTKYAFFSQVELDQLRTEDLDVSHTLEKLVITGWLQQTPRQIHRQLIYAIRRQRAPVSYSKMSRLMYFTFAEHESWKAADTAENLHRAFSTEGDADLMQCRSAGALRRSMVDQGRLDAYMLLYGLVQESLTAWDTTQLTVMAIVMAAVHSLIPPAVRVVRGEPFAGSSMEEIIVCVGVLFVSINMMRANVLYVVCAIFDYRRRLFQMVQCSALLDIHYRSARTRHLRSVPPLDLDEPRNLYNWVQVRRVLKDYGLQFFMRVTAYAGFLLLVVLAFVVFVIVEAFSVAESESGTQLETSTLVLSVYDLCIVFGLLLCLALLGKDLNRQHARHASILVRHQADIQKRIHLCLLSPSDPTTTSADGSGGSGGGQPADDEGGIEQSMSASQRHARAQMLSNSHHMIDTVIRLLSVDDEENPVRILGFRADASFSRGIATLLVTGIGVAIRILIASDTGV